MAPRWLKVLRSNRAASRLVLTGSVLLVVSTLATLLARFDRKSLLPGKEERYDVTQIFFAPMADVCADGASSLKAESFERCAESMSLEDGRRSGAFRAIAIPSFEESLAGRTPTFRTALKQQNLPELDASLVRREPYVVGLRIPAKYFRENRIGEDANVLVFDGLQDARVCVEGRCPLVVSKYDQMLLLFPLSLRAAPKLEFVDVFFFGKDTVFAYGPIIEGGLYVTPPSKLHGAKKLLPILNYGRSVVLATLFVGLFLMAFGFAAIWAEFLDYGAFCYLTASFALYTIANETSIVKVKDWTVLDFHQFRVISEINLLAALVAFALATNRTRPRRVVAALAIILTAGIAYVIVSAPSQSTDAIVRWSNAAEHVLTWMMLVIPVAIISLGAWRCFLKFRAAKRSGPLSLRLDFQRRTLEQAIYAVFIFGITLQQLAQNLAGRSGSVDPMRFAPSTGFLLFGIFTVIIYHSTTKLAKTHFRSDGISEAARLKGRMTTRAYYGWLQETRRGIMLQVDVKNSSVASSVLKSKIHVLMQNLNDAMKRSHAKLGYHWILAKKNGDEWIVILSAKNGDLKQDLAEVLAATRRDAHDWRRLVQDMAPECSLHVNVFALTGYSLAGERVRAEGGRAGIGSWEVIDFASREANYLMKWAGKSSRPNSLTVGANLALFSERDLDEATSSTRVSSMISTSGDPNAESVLDADSMSLTLLCLPLEAETARRAA